MDCGLMHRSIVHATSMSVCYDHSWTLLATLIESTTSYVKGSIQRVFQRWLFGLKWLKFGSWSLKSTTIARWSLLSMYL